ncbi:MAG: hypothetical protein WC637_01535 [Victivallales bacterium]|jgi:hypothetical protein
MRNKIRVLLHAMTFKRDFGFVYCLSRILDHLGCEVSVCSNTDYISLPMRLWKPDVVFYVTVGRTEQLRKNFPDAQLVLWNAESCRFDTYPSFELEIASDPAKYQYMGRVFLWGKETKRMIADYAEKNNWKWITGDINAFDRKFVVVGHPRLDLAKYGTRKPVPGKDKIKIGIIGLCSGINNGKFSVLEILLDDKNADGNFSMSKEFCFQNKYLQLARKLILDFGTDKYEYSLRPYFLENIPNYSSSELVKSGKLAIDDSIEFTSWLKNQDLIIGAVSTTMYLVAATGKPYISVDYMLGRPLERIVFAEEYLSGILKHCPKTYEDFSLMVNNYKDFDLNFDSSPILKDQFIKFLSAKEDLPVLFLMSREIIQIAIEHKRENGLPTKLCRALNSLRTAYAEFRGLASNAGDYSHFRKSAIQIAELEFGKTIDDICASIPHEQKEALSGMMNAIGKS